MRARRCDGRCTVARAAGTRAAGGARAGAYATGAADLLRVFRDGARHCGQASRGRDRVRAAGKVSSFSTRTDATGAFRATVPQGTYLISVRKPGFEENERTLTLAGDTMLEVTLRPGIVVGGLITELGVGPLDDAKVEIVSGPSAGQNTLSGHPISGRYALSSLVPGEFRMRVSKIGYKTVEQTVNAPISTTQNFTLKWAYGTCLQSVAPVAFGPYLSTGGGGASSVNVNPGRTWTATPSSSWIEVVSRPMQTGPAQLSFRVLRNPPGDMGSRRGAVMIRCATGEGQNLWITQNPDCEVRLEAAFDSPAVFDAEGGLLHLVVRTGTRGCLWESSSAVDWIHTIGIRSWPGDQDVRFVVDRNATGTPRTGDVIIGETHWTVTLRR